MQNVKFKNNRITESENNKEQKFIVTLIKNSENYPDPAVFNWIADGLEDAVNIVEKTIKEIREDYKEQGYNSKEYYNFPGRKKWSKKNCFFHILENYYDFHITKIEDKTKNFFWDCK